MVRNYLKLLTQHLIHFLKQFTMSKYHKPSTYRINRIKHLIDIDNGVRHIKTRKSRFRRRVKVLHRYRCMDDNSPRDFRRCRICTPLVLRYLRTPGWWEPSWPRLLKTSMGPFQDQNYLIIQIEITSYHNEISLIYHATPQKNLTFLRQKTPLKFGVT